MGRTLLLGNPGVEITLRRSARARRISLRVSALDGRVTLSLPKGVPESAALAFAEEKSDWIRKHLARNVSGIVPGIGATVLWKGQERRIIAGPVRRAVAEGDAIVVPDDDEMAPARIRALMKLAARAELTAACATYGDLLGRVPGRITLRDTRSRWGSCSARGDLNFSWRLIMAAPEVLDYVAAHEVAHLIEMNHSRAYWDVVASICPDYARPRQWLRENGQVLHRYRFGD